jgi:hypothetical protein
MITPQARFLPFDPDPNPFNPLPESVDSLPPATRLPAHLEAQFTLARPILSSQIGPSIEKAAQEPADEIHVGQDEAQQG